MTDTLEELREVAATVYADCATDAAKLDSTPLTASGIGETFGATLAMIAALAKVCEKLCDKLAVTP